MRRTVGPLIALIATVVIALGVYLMATSQNVLIVRDPAVYSATAAWLDGDGSLFVDDPPEDQLESLGVLPDLVKTAVLSDVTVCAGSEVVGR